MGRMVSLTLIGVWLATIASSRMGGGFFDTATAASSDPGCVKSGAGSTYFGVCISAEGNLSVESPAGYVQVNDEGYVLCSEVGVHGFDYASQGEGFNAPVITQPNGPNTVPLTIARTTVDGLFEMTQQFARDTAELDVSITTKIRNLSGSSIGSVILQRHADMNIDNTNDDDFFARTKESVWAWEQAPMVGPGRGLMLTNANQAIIHATWVSPTWLGGPISCTAATVATPTARGDYAAALGFVVGTIAPGKTKTVKLAYRRL